MIVVQIFTSEYRCEGIYFSLPMEVFLGTKHKDKSVVSIAGEVRRKHMAIFGKSGVGKTTLMRNMVFADLQNGNGITVIDPHGSLVQDLLEVDLTGILYQFVREYSEGFERDGGVGQGPAFEALAPHQH
jgi:DNA helicase HerA-like ATPase